LIENLKKLEPGQARLFFLQFFDKNNTHASEK